MTLTVGSLFSGIGGLDLGLERAGMSVIWQSEINPYASKILKKHWPEVINYGDIKKIKWADVVRPDILCGGYPCQPFSTAGKRRGTDDPRHLWPWVRQAISELRPNYVILENVRGHVTLGLSTVLGEMATLGYNAEWNIISAASVGAPHRRDRVIIVAYPEIVGGYVRKNRNNTSSTNEGEKMRVEIGTIGSYVADTTQQSSNGKPDYAGNSQQPKTIPELGNSSWESHRSRQWWAIEPNVGRVANGVPSRVDRLKCLGNAVVPQVAELVGLLVIQHMERVAND